MFVIRIKFLEAQFLANGVCFLPINHFNEFEDFQNVFFSLSHLVMSHEKAENCSTSIFKGCLDVLRLHVNSSGCIENCLREQVCLHASCNVPTKFQSQNKYGTHVVAKIDIKREEN